MKVLRNAAALTFLAGLALLTLGLISACGSDGDDEPNEFDAVESPTSAPESTATPEPTATTAPEPTATPFDGEVARFQIPRFGIDSPVENIGINANNQLDVPQGPANTGWYGIYDRPGWNGNAVFSAHVSLLNYGPGPFYDLARTEEGDRFVIVMEDGTEYVYEAIRMKRYHVDTIPMGELIDAPDKPEGEEWITLITCGGETRPIAGSNAVQFLERDVVVARRVMDTQVSVSQ